MRGNQHPQQGYQKNLHGAFHQATEAEHVTHHHARSNLSVRQVIDITVYGFFRVDIQVADHRLRQVLGGCVRAAAGLDLGLAQA
ncbi:hypothetical protein D9M73_248700 [compost metagenome]